MDDFAAALGNLDILGVLRLVLGFIRDYFLWIFGGFLAFLAAWVMKSRRK